VTKRKFIKEFFKNKHMVGAVSPSSKFLANKMLENVDFEDSKLVVELGPGTGVFTDKIIQRLRPKAKLLVFELNKDFYQSLQNRINDPRVEIIHDSASNISNYLKDDEKNTVDTVISSLPLMAFPEDLRNDVVNASYDALKDDGMYIQFQYSLQSKKLLASKYAKMDITFTVKNFPPAFVYTCLKK